MQATRRTPLSPTDPADPADPAGLPLTRRRTSRVPLLAAGVALVALGADVLSKHLAVADLGDGHRVRLLGDLLQLVLTRNPGAAFSTGSSYTVVISLFAVVAAVVVVGAMLRVRHRAWACALGLLLGGILGNLADRLFRAPAPLRGHVVDFIALPHWPVFNLADVCIDVGGVLLLVLVLRRTRLDGSRAEG